MQKNSVFSDFYYLANKLKRPAPSPAASKCLAANPNFLIALSQSADHLSSLGKEIT